MTVEPKSAQELLKINMLEGSTLNLNVKGTQTGRFTRTAPHSSDDLIYLNIVVVDNSDPMLEETFEILTYSDNWLELFELYEGQRWFMHGRSFETWPAHLIGV